MLSDENADKITQLALSNNDSAPLQSPISPNSQDNKKKNMLRDILIAPKTNWEKLDKPF